MRKILMAAFACLIFFASCGRQAVEPMFKPYVIEGLEPRADFWKVRVGEIDSLCRSVSRGRAEVVARTPLGYPVWAVFYGDFSKPEPQTNFSAGNSSSALTAYTGGDDGIQTILFAAGVHGSEPESVASAVNMIKMLETGTDFRGVADEEFLELVSHYRFIIMPCVNMDGRTISPDHFRGQPYEVFRGCSQGWWKDGSLVGWRGSKEWFPLPLDKVQYPGGYPNSQGYNIQHDAAPGDMKTEEAKAVCRLMARYRVDFFLNGHSCEYDNFIIPPSAVNPPQLLQTGSILCEKMHQAFFEAGLQKEFKNPTKCSNTYNLTSLAAWCSGGLGLTLECCHCCGNQQGIDFIYSFEEMMQPAFIALKTAMRYGLENDFACRK